MVKLLVYFIYAIQLSQVMMFTHDGFHKFVARFGNFEALDELDENWVSGSLLIGIGAVISVFPTHTTWGLNKYNTVGCAVQLFYAWRIWIISRSRIPPLVIVLV